MPDYKQNRVFFKKGPLGPAQCYLLLNGELPNKQQRKEFFTKINQHTLVHEQIRNFFSGTLNSFLPRVIFTSLEK